MKLKIFNSLGFTFPELLVAVSIAVLIGGVLMMIMVNNTGLFYQQSSKVDQGLRLNDALTNIRTSVRDAKSVAASYPESAPFTYVTGPGTLVLKLPTITPAGALIPTTFDYTVYYTQNIGSPPVKALKLKTFPDAQSAQKPVDKILSHNVDSIVFKFYSGPDEVPPVSAKKIMSTLTLKQKAGANYETKTATMEAFLRND